MKTIFNHITLAKVTNAMFHAIAAGLLGLVIIGLTGIIYTIITDPSVIDNASFGIYR